MWSASGRIAQCPCCLLQMLLLLAVFAFCSCHASPAFLHPPTPSLRPHRPAASLHPPAASRREAACGCRRRAVQLHLQAQKGDAEDTAENGEPKAASRLNDDSGAITPNGPDVDDIMQGIAQLQAGLATIQAGLGKRASGAQASVQVHRADAMCATRRICISQMV